MLLRKCYAMQASTNMAKKHRISAHPFLPSSLSIHTEAQKVSSGKFDAGAIPMNSMNGGNNRKAWVAPVLHRLTIDLEAIRQKRSGNTDAKGNGAVS